MAIEPKVAIEPAIDLEKIPTVQPKVREIYKRYPSFGNIRCPKEYKIPLAKECVSEAVGQWGNVEQNLNTFGVPRKAFPLGLTPPTHIHTHTHTHTQYNEIVFTISPGAPFIRDRVYY